MSSGLESTSSLAVRMDASVRKLESQVLTIYKDLLSLTGSLGYHSSKISSLTARISNKHADLQRIQDDIARRRGCFGSTASARILEEDRRREMSSRPSGMLHLNSALPVSKSLQRITPERMPSVDTRCYETALLPEDLVTDQMLDADGFLEYPEWESQEWHIPNSPTPL